MRCRYCHNPEFVLSARLWANHYTEIHEDTFFSFLHQRKELLDGVVICGGEPTIHRDLEAFCEKVKKLGLLVKLDTNWTNPKVLEELIQKWLVDYVAMDIKTNHKQRQTLLQISKLYDVFCKSVEVLLEGDVEYEFRTTMIKNYHSEECFLEMLQQIEGAKNYYLQAYRPQKTLDPTFDGIPFSRYEIEEYRHLASSYVKKCEVRR